METRGAIYHHSHLVFHNGFVGKKYLILLNTPTKTEPYLFVKTTSQTRDKPATPGCIKERSLFFIPAGKTFFQVNTWVQLYEIYPILPKEVDTNKNISIKGRLDVKLTNDIVKCLFETEEDNIAPVFKKLLRPPIQDSLRKLKTQFDEKCGHFPQTKKRGSH